MLQSAAEAIAEWLTRVLTPEEPCVICGLATRGRTRHAGVSYVVCDYEDQNGIACRHVWHYRLEREFRENFDEGLRERPEAIDELPDHEPIDERDSYRDYQSYIRSREWETKAMRAKSRAGWMCQGCGLRYDPADRSTILHVHHLHYRTLYKERWQDVKVLCQDCHKRAHGRL